MAFQLKLWVDKAAAIKAGRATFGEVELTVTDEWVAALSPIEREELLEVLGERMATPAVLGSMISVPTPGRGYGRDIQTGVKLAEATLDSARQLLTARAIAREEALLENAREEVALEAERQRLLRCPVGELVTQSAPLRAAEGVYYEYHVSVSCPPERRTEARAEADTWSAESFAPIKAAREAAAQQRAERIAEEERAEHEWVKALDVWVQINAPEHHARRADRHMTDDEVLALIRDAAFEPAHALARFERLTDDDVCDGGCGAEFSVEEEAVPLTPAQFDQLTELRRLLPSAEVKARVHVGVCNPCEARLERVAALATVEWHGRKLSREFAL